MAAEPWGARVVRSELGADRYYDRSGMAACGGHLGRGVTRVCTWMLKCRTESVRVRERV